MDSTDLFDHARQALATATVRAADLIVTAPDLSLPARACDWSLREVAVHLIMGAGMWTEIAQGAPGPFTTLDPAYIRAECERRHADIPETDPAKLAGLMVDAIETFLDATSDRPGDDPVTFQMGMPFTLSGLVGTRLGEVILHGYDMASVLGRPWVIDPMDAMVVLAAYTPVFALIVHPERTRNLTAGFGIELRGAGAMTVRFTDGVYGIEEAGSGPVDATISADPVAFLMVGSGRLKTHEAVALGLFSAAGERPDLGLAFPDLFLFA